MAPTFEPRVFSNQQPKLAAGVAHRALVFCEGEDEYDILTVLCNQKQITEAQVSLKIVKRGDLDKELRLFSKSSRKPVLACVYDVEEGSAVIDLDALVRAHGLDRECPLAHRLQFPLHGNGSLESQIKNVLQADPSEDLSCVNQWQLCAKATMPGAYSTAAQWDKAWLQVWLAARMETTAFSRVGYAIAKSPRIANALLPTLQPFSNLIDSLVETPHV